MSKTNPLKYAAVADLMAQHDLMATAVEAHGVICGLVCGGVQTANATVYMIDTVLMPPAA